VADDRRGAHEAADRARQAHPGRARGCAATVLAAGAGKGFEARRDTALLLLLMDIGPRRGELANVQLADVDFDLEVIAVLGKGRRPRSLPFGRNSALALDRYLRVRARHRHAHLPWLWWPQGAI
jgi:integrase/recombinase XerC